jgi:hypothetical protein
MGYSKCFISLYFQDILDCEVPSTVLYLESSLDYDDRSGVKYSKGITQFDRVDQFNRNSGVAGLHQILDCRRTCRLATGPLLIVWKKD